MKKLIIFLCALLASVTMVAASEVKFRDLYGRGGAYSELAQKMTHKTITVRGYMAPPIKAEASFFVLTKLPMSVCPFCETEADWPTDILFVRTPKQIDVLPFNEPIYVTGTLEIGASTDPETGFVSRVRLVDAKYRKAR
ncbi:MAG: hypothetical protein P8X74_16875 [Reinekea sp.]